MDRFYASGKKNPWYETERKMHRITTRESRFFHNEPMKSVQELPAKSIHTVFCDIDDTLTTDGKLPAASFQALWDLHDRGIRIIPVTGRPAGWCEMIARFWPVQGIVGENGALYFFYDSSTKKMRRVFAESESSRRESLKKLEKVKNEILDLVPNSALSSDQFCRISDLAIDFCEDIPPLSSGEIKKIVETFEKHGATAKVSSIHVNGWFGKYDKFSMCKKVIEDIFQKEWSEEKNSVLFIGDSPNDEPMFKEFPISVAVANIRPFLRQLKHHPPFICSKEGSSGFVELAEHLLSV